MSEKNQNPNTNEISDGVKENPSFDVPDFTPGDKGNTYLPPPVSEGDEAAIEAKKTPMKRLFDRYSYSIIRIYLTQFAIGLFGTSLAMATAKDKGALYLLTGVFSLLFFAFLIHSVVWNLGAQDRIAVDGGRRKRNLFTGTAIGLIAGIPNFIFATIYTICFFSGAHNVAALMKIIIMFTEGMYWSFLSTFTCGGMELHLHWWSYFVIAVFTILLVTISYLTGYFKLKCTNILVEKSNETLRAEKEAKEKYRMKK